MNKIIYGGLARPLCAALLLLAVMLGATLPFAANAQTPDPGLVGPHTVVKQQYDLGDAAYTPPAGAMFPMAMEVRGSVHYPSDLSSGPFPVIVFLHGRHSTCYETADPGNVTSSWPCPTGFQSIVSYEGYDYLASTLASNGYIVISVSCNAINAIDGGLTDAGMNARGYLVQHHLDLWKIWNTTGGTPFGTTFVGRLDMKNIGTMGHSRGGEGVVYNALLNRSLGNPYGIRAVLTLAPVDFFRQVLNGIPLMNVAPYCDGDVNDLEGVHFYDDARYSNLTDEAPKHNVLLLGANHDFFNTVWTPASYIAGGADDWEDYGYSSTDPFCGTSMPTRFNAVKQQAALNVYLPAFFRVYLGHENKFAPILMVDNVIPPASSTLDTTNVFVSYHPGRSWRFDVNREDTTFNITTNTASGAVSSTGLVSSGICGGGLAEASCSIAASSAQEPHKGDVTQRGLSQMTLRWNDTADVYENVLPATAQNLSLFNDIQFRASVNFSNSPLNQNLDFSVVLVDSAGNAGSVPVTNYSHALFFQKGVEGGDLPKALFNTIKIPLASFGGVNLAKVRKIRFKFNRSTVGSILVSDITFATGICGKLNATFSQTVTPTGNKVIFTNNTVLNTGDSVTWLWKFGNPTSGTADTSTQKNPTHIYTAVGTYTACLYANTYQKNFINCADTFCVSIVISKLAVPEVAGDNITIVPNPAKDYLLINGADPADRLTLIDLYGQVILSQLIPEPRVQLPTNISTGIYYAIITTEAGNKVYRKILITR